MCYKGVYRYRFKSRLRVGRYCSRKAYGTIKEYAEKLFTCYKGVYRYRFKSRLRVGRYCSRKNLDTIREHAVKLFRVD